MTTTSTVEAFTILKITNGQVCLISFDSDGHKVSEIVNFWPTLVNKETHEEVSTNEKSRTDDFYEGDLLYRTDLAFMVENDVRITHQNMVAYIDIETNARGGTDPKNAKEMPIYVISVKGRDGRHETFYSKEGRLEDEAETIRKAVGLMQKYGVLVAHNGREFDFPVLKKRAEMLGVPIMWDEFICLDSEDMHEFMLRQREDSYSLDALARKYLKEGKADFDSSKTHVAWETPEGREKMAVYCARDVELLARLDAKMYYVDVLYRICDLTHCPPASYIWRPNADDFKNLRFAAIEEKPSPFNSSILADCAILYESRRHTPRFAWPTKPTKSMQAVNKGVKLPGGQTIRPNPGLYTNIVVLDYDSLYPRLFVSMNLGPDTFDPSGDIKGIPGRFRSEPTSIVAEMAKKLLTMRDDVKRRKAEAEKVGDRALEEILKAESDALKIVVNTATYGVFGSATSREFSPLIQANIIFGTRAAVNYLTKEIASRGIEVIFSDTDSLGLAVLPAQFNWDAAEKLAKELTDVANTALREKHGCKDPSLKLKVEEMNVSMFFRKTKSGNEAAKKSYGMKMFRRNGSTEFKFVGIEKSNIPVLEIIAMKTYYTRAMELGTMDGADEVLDALRAGVLEGRTDDYVFKWIRLRKFDYGPRRPAQLVAHEMLTKHGAAPEPGEPVGIAIFGKGKKRHRIAARRIDGRVELYDESGKIDGLSKEDREEAVVRFIDSVVKSAEPDDDTEETSHLLGDS